MKHYTSIGPNPGVVRMFIAEKGLTPERVDMDILAGTNRQADYLAINPLGTTPALILDDGQVIAESVAICEYLEEKHPSPVLIGSTPEMRANTRTWVRRLDIGFTTPLTLGFRAQEGRAMFEPRMRVARNEAGDDLKAMAWDMLDFVQTQMAGRDYVAGDAFTLADIVMFQFIGFSQAVGMTPLAGRDALGSWFTRIAERPSAKA